MAKSQSAFRTISEVATSLDTPTHVLRFWESKFSQVKPVKRAGGRRYYRPEDVQLLAGIKALLHDQGMTIKGAQKLLREQGVKHVLTLGPTSDTAPTSAVETAPEIPQPIIEPDSIVPDNIVVMPHPPAVTARQTAPRPQILAMLVAANQSAIRCNSGAISPHITQLAALRDRIRQSL